MPDPVRVLFLGLRCAFSYDPLAALTEAGLDVVAVAIPGPEAPRWSESGGVRLVPRPRLPLLGPGDQHDIVPFAWRRSIPVLEVSRLDEPETLARLAAYRPDVIALACFPWRLPPPVLALPRLGCLNVHPSLLPANRGPAPLFWTFRLGESRTGVTVHLVDERLDAGDIVLQEAIAVPDGIAGPDLEALCSQRGAQLLVAAIRGLASGTSVRRKQTPELASHHPWPLPDDFFIDPARPARWAFNFIRGVAHWSLPLVFRSGGREFVLESALSYCPEGTLGRPYVRRGGELRVQCSPGILRATLHGPARPAPRRN